MLDDSRERERLFLIAANALYLSRINFVIKQRGQPRELRDSELDRADYSSSYRLHECLSAPGIIDDRLESQFDNRGLFPWQNEDLEQLIRSDAEIAKITFRDVLFSDAEKETLVQANGGKMTWQDWSIPICRWEPGEVIWQAREIVLRFLEGVNGLGASTLSSAVPYSWPSDLANRLVDPLRFKRDPEFVRKILTKAERLAFMPIISEYEKDAEIEKNQNSTTKALKIVADKGKSDEVLSSLTDLGFELCERYSLISDKIIKAVFPAWDEFREDYRAEAHPFNLFMFACSQIGWWAISKGIAICVADDGIVDLEKKKIGDGVLSLVDPASIQPLSRQGALMVPSELEADTFSSLNDKFVRLVGAERVWFVLARDLLDQQSKGQALSPGNLHSLGPRNGLQISEEKEIAKLLSQAVIDCPDKKATKSDVVEVICTKFNWSKRAANRVWDSVNKYQWSKPGKPKAGSKIGMQEIDGILSIQ